MLQPSETRTSDTGPGWVAARSARATTGLKMFLYLILGLLPLGLIAVLASIENVRESRTEHAADARARLELAAERVGGTLARGALMLRVPDESVGPAQDRALCSRNLTRIARAAGLPGRYALIRNGVADCATAAFSPPQASNGALQESVQILSDGQTLRLLVFGLQGTLVGVGELSREQLAQLVGDPVTSHNSDLFLSAGNQRLQLVNGFQAQSLEGRLELGQAIVAGQLALNMTTNRVEISAAAMLTVLLPVLMWLAAAVIGWLIVDRLLLRPLVRMQQAVAAYRPGDRELALPSSKTPAREIGDLGGAFARVTQTVSRHEADLEAGLERQIRLVREVHHRVKNNLQVVASLLNLHARGATSPDASAAYASIQRRVDALAVVHRNHYAELEDNRGVALKPLLSELGASLRATAPPSVSDIQLRLAIEPHYVTQDVAVSVAFLVTELVEFAMLCEAEFVTVSLDRTRAGAALISAESDALLGTAECDPKLAERFDRIVTGLSRQLRSVISKDTEQGVYALEIAILERPAD